MALKSTKQKIFIFSKKEVISSVHLGKPFLPDKLGYRLRKREETNSVSLLAFSLGLQ